MFRAQRGQGHYVTDTATDVIDTVTDVIDADTDVIDTNTDVLDTDTDVIDTDTNVIDTDVAEWRVSCPERPLLNDVFRAQRGRGH